MLVIDVLRDRQLRGPLGRENPKVKKYRRSSLRRDAGRHIGDRTRGHAYLVFDSAGETRHVEETLAWREVLSVPPINRNDVVWCRSDDVLLGTFRIALCGSARRVKILQLSSRRRTEKRQLRPALRDSVPNLKKQDRALRNTPLPRAAQMLEHRRTVVSCTQSYKAVRPSTSRPTECHA